MRLRIHEFGGHDPVVNDYFESEEEPRLSVTVVHTTPAGTVAALRAAALLAKNLDVRLGLIMTEVVPFRLPIDQPRRSVEFLKQLQENLVAEAGLESEEILVQICVCRDTRETLGRLLPTPSLIVLGGRRGWWPSREQRIETFLSRLGHHVVFVDLAADKPAAESGSSAGNIISPQPSMR
jgi:hypothetical protein